MANPFQFVTFKEKESYIGVEVETLEQAFEAVKKHHPQYEKLYKEGSPGHMSIFHTSFKEENILAEGCVRLRKQTWKLRIRKPSK